MREEEIKQLEISKESWRNLYWEECEKNKTQSKEIAILNSQISEYIKEINRLKDNAMEDMKVQTELEEKIRFLEDCLDRKEKVNKELREELEMYKKIAEGDVVYLGGFGL